MLKRPTRLTLIIGGVGLLQLLCFAGLYVISGAQPAGQGGSLASLVTAFLPLTLVGVGFVVYAWFRLRRRR
jgi:hypothetical protein